MVEIKYFLLPDCPHCKLATRLIEEVKAEHPEYAGITFQRIDESREKEYADSFDYYYVPCFFLNGKKLHEGHAEKPDILRVFSETLRLT